MDSDTNSCRSRQEDKCGRAKEGTHGLGEDASDVQGLVSPNVKQDVSDNPPHSEPGSCPKHSLNMDCAHSM
jgi:hypothetical protein